MQELKSAVSTLTKIKVVRAIESGIRMETVAETMGLSIEKVKAIRARTNMDIKAVSAFLQTASVSQKKLTSHAVRSSGVNELSSRRESLGVSLPSPSRSGSSSDSSPDPIRDSAPLAAAGQRIIENHFYS